MEMNFEGKVVLVTGASVGIGKSIALLFAEFGAKLALVGQNEANLREAAEQCGQKRGNTPLAIIADLSTDNGCETVAKKTIEHFKRLDVLVNNAGVGTRTNIQRADMATYDRIFNLNVRGVYNLTRLLVPELIKTKGNIVNISSIAGTKVAVGSLPYGMSKAALDHFSNLIALELAPLGVRVNTVSPGITISNFIKRIFDCTEEEYQKWLSTAVGAVPMGEVCTGEDVAKMVVHLASDNSRLVTGTIVQIDGGSRFGNSGAVLQQQLK